MNTEDKLNKEIAKRVRSTREEEGLSQEDLGSKLGLSKVGYGHYERGTHPFNIWQILQVSRILNRPVEYFLGLPTGLTGREERVLALFRLAEERGLGDVAIGVIHAVVAQLLTTSGQLGEQIGDKP